MTDHRQSPVRQSQVPYAFEGQQIALVDLLDRVLAGGVVIAGEITLSIADVDLVRISLRALIASIRPGMEASRATEADARRSGRDEP
ncbi:gas vesicle protein [Streptomyces sp. NBC_00322]|uniref:gas vesicle protein n=1 Tax=Streptomyces sp. NBC_00322 TaxID=2975712 RepID=UPI002E292A8B|nr:gas vesicle protein [Streptomyces sp. NBC_00322]